MSIYPYMCAISAARIWMALDIMFKICEGHARTGCGIAVQRLSSVVRKCVDEPKPPHQHARNSSDTVEKVPQLSRDAKAVKSLVTASIVSSIKMLRSEISCPVR